MKIISHQPRFFVSCFSLFSAFPASQKVWGLLWGLFFESSVCRLLSQYLRGILGVKKWRRRDSKSLGFWHLSRIPSVSKGFSMIERNDHLLPVVNQDQKCFGIYTHKQKHLDNSAFIIYNKVRKYGKSYFPTII